MCSAEIKLSLLQSPEHIVPLMCLEFELLKFQKWKAHRPNLFVVSYAVNCPFHHSKFLTPDSHFSPGGAWHSF